VASKKSLHENLIVLATKYKELKEAYTETHNDNVAMSSALKDSQLVMHIQKDYIRTLQADLEGLQESYNQVVDSVAVETFGCGYIPKKTGVKNATPPKNE